MLVFFFFNDTAASEIYTLALHGARPIVTGEALTVVWDRACMVGVGVGGGVWVGVDVGGTGVGVGV